MRYVTSDDARVPVSARRIANLAAREGWQVRITYADNESEGSETIEASVSVRVVRAPERMAAVWHKHSASGKWKLDAALRAVPLAKLTFAEFKEAIANGGTVETEAES